jgi:hypothetical protein
LGWSLVGFELVSIQARPTSQRWVNATARIERGMILDVRLLPAYSTAAMASRCASLWRLDKRIYIYISIDIDIEFSILSAASRAQCGQVGMNQAPAHRPYVYERISHLEVWRASERLATSP